MNILMMSNTYAPIIGGIERSIQSFTDEYRKLGHHVVIVAPQFKDQPKRERGVIRIPSIQNFNGTDFSVNVPIPEFVSKKLKEMRPHVIHAHHPFLMGDMALRLASEFDVPLVFTYHTLYEEYLNHWFHDPKRFKRFVNSLAIGYANLADQVFAPSKSVYDLLIRRGVTAPIEVMPTGIDLERFQQGKGKALKTKFRIPAGSLVIGHAGRLSSEKNVKFLVQCVITFMKKNPSSIFLLVGDGESREEIKNTFEEAGLTDRLRDVGMLKGSKLVDAYHAMDVFVFASHSETQGLVLLEAMASGVPVIAMDGPGVRDVVRDFKNGRLIHSESKILFSSVLKWFSNLNGVQKRELKKEAELTASEYAMPRTAKRALELYTKTVRRKAYEAYRVGPNFWERGMHRIKAEWGLFKNVMKAAGNALVESSQETEEPKKVAA